MSRTVRTSDGVPCALIAPPFRTKIQSQYAAARLDRAAAAIVVSPSRRNQSQGLVLVPDVQVCRRFVQAGKHGVCASARGNHDALLFAAGEAVEVTIGQRRDASTRASADPTIVMISGWRSLPAVSCAVPFPSARFHLPKTPFRSRAPGATTPTSRASSSTPRSQTPRPSTETWPVSGRSTR